MSLAPWASLDAGTVQALIGRLLARRHPNSVRLKPGRGDGGIDIFVPLGERRAQVDFGGQLALGEAGAGFQNRRVAKKRFDAWRAKVGRQGNVTRHSCDDCGRVPSRRRV